MTASVKAWGGRSYNVERTRNGTSTSIFCSREELEELRRDIDAILGVPSVCTDSDSPKPEGLASGPRADGEPPSVRGGHRAPRAGAGEEPGVPFAGPVRSRGAAVKEGPSFRGGQDIPPHPNVPDQHDPAPTFMMRHVDCSQGHFSDGMGKVYKHASDCKYPDEHTEQRPSEVLPKCAECGDPCPPNEITWMARRFCSLGCAEVAIDKYECEEDHDATGNPCPKEDAPRPNEAMCAQCGATPAPYVENRCMLHYGGQTVQRPDNAVPISCAECGAPDAPYLEHRCMLHYGGQTKMVCPETARGSIDAVDADDVLDALAASIADCEIDYEDVTTPERAREAALELLREVRIGLAIDPTSNRLRREPAMPTGGTE